MTLLRTSLTGVSSLLANDIFENADNNFKTLLATGLVGTATEISLCPVTLDIDVNIKQLKSTEMIIESMTLEELEELRELIVIEEEKLETEQSKQLIKENVL